MKTPAVVILWSEEAMFWGAHAPSRADFGAPPKYLGKISDGGGAVASTRWRVRSPELADPRFVARLLLHFFYDQYHARSSTRPFRLLAEFRGPLQERRA